MEDKPQSRREVERAVDTRMIRIRPGEVVDRMHPRPDVTITREWSPIPSDVADVMVAADPPQVEVQPTGTDTDQKDSPDGADPH